MNRRRLFMRTLGNKWISNGLTAYYRLNGNADDFVGNAHGIAYNPIWENPIANYGGSWKNNGDNSSYIDVDDEIYKFQGFRDFSFSFFMKQNISTSRHYGWMLRLSQELFIYDYNANFRVWFGDNNNGVLYEYTQINNGHLIITISSSGDVFVYKNGIRINEIRKVILGNGFAGFSGNQTLQIGLGYQSRYFGLGQIQGLGFWHNVISDSLASVIYQSQINSDLV